MPIISLQELKQPKTSGNIVSLNQLRSQQPSEKPSFLGRRFTPEQVEERIRGQEDILTPAVTQAKGELAVPAIAGGGIRLRTALRVVGGAFQRVESALAAPVLGTLRRFKEEAGGRRFSFREKLARQAEPFKEFKRGLTGERFVERGDVF
ncbi:MAG TPA: hypothetical protein ENI23_06495, partial [bacterium]|nr:hypothetical protein [bacterium]